MRGLKRRPIDAHQPTPCHQYEYVPGILRHPPTAAPTRFLHSKVSLHARWAPSVRFVRDEVSRLASPKPTGMHHGIDLDWLLLFGSVLAVHVARAVFSRPLVGILRAPCLYPCRCSFWSTCAAASGTRASHRGSTSATGTIFLRLAKGPAVVFGPNDKPQRTKVYPKRNLEAHPHLMRLCVVHCFV